MLGNERIELEPTGNFQSLEDIGQTIIQIPGSDQVFYLRDIATISRAYIDPPSTKVRASGAPAIALAISMREGGNNIALGRQVTAVIQRLQNAYPYGIDFETINFSPQEVENKVSGFISNLVQAIAVVAAVIILSLGLRTGLVVTVLIPASMVLAVLVMSVLDIGLDQISLAALIIALGMLVDNGIVMSENILVRMNGGQKPVDAAVDSALELRIPLLTSSLTTAAAFLPIFLAESSTGEFTASLFKVVTITLLCSWLLSLTIIPLLCVSFLKTSPQKNPFDNTFYTLYRALLNSLLRFRYLTLLAVALLFFIAVSCFKYIPSLFFPPSDRAFFTAEIELPLGTTIYRTEAIVKQIEGYMADTLHSGTGTGNGEGITNWVSYIGSGGPRFVISHTAKAASANYALLVINTTSAKIINATIQKLDDYTFTHFPDAQVTLKKIESGPSVANPVEIRLYGRDTDTLFRIVSALKQKMASMPTLKNINDDWGQRIKKLRVNIDQARALRAGVSSQDIASSLQIGLSGLELTQYREGGDTLPITLRATGDNRQDISTLQALAVYSQSSGTSVPLTQVADLAIEWQVAKILRRDQLKTVTVGAQLTAGASATHAFAALTPWLAQQQRDWPVGYRYELGGEAESSGKANQSIADKLPIAIAIILLLLVAQFNSLRKPLIILITIPLGFIGVIFGLLIAQSFFGFMTFLGIISLSGIVINNAIVLLERIKQEIEDNGLAPLAGIVEAAQRRLRPILLTTATTVLGLLPLYFGGGEMWEPMAVAIIAGLLFSTLLTLCIVPVMYALLYNVK